ncbi:MAG TPA: ATP-binding protein [Urbifossiella sp.]|nr:ATP-binding protein [Urbifossiella sp.]
MDAHEQADVSGDDREGRAALAQALRMESELRRVLESASTALWSAERAPAADALAGWEFRYVSPLLTNIAGRPIDRPFRWAEAIHAPDRNRYLRTIRGLLSSSEAETEQVYRVVAPGGAIRWVRDRLQVVRDSSGCPIRLTGSIVDVTRQRAIEHAVRQSERRFRALVEKGGDGIVLLDDGARVLYASPSVRTISGHDPTAIVGTDCCGYLSPENQTSARQLLRELLRRPGEDLPWRGRAHKADGAAQLLEVNACNRLADPSVRAIVLNYRDVTERNRLEDDLRQAAKMEAVGRLAGGIAHDFNNLLTVILGNLELVRGGVDGADADDLLASAETAARQAADLTRQMLGFARRQPLQPTVVDVNELVLEQLSLLRRTIDPRIAIEFEPDPDVNPVLADAVQVQQILMNLCLNARDAMPEGGTIAIEAWNAEVPPGAHIDGPGAEGYICLSVADSGQGMSDEVRAKVFEPFFTTKEIGRGTGLGLSMVYGVAKAHGGWVECHSVPGSGSRFDVYLPYAPPDLTPPPTAANPAAAQGQGQSILLADDEPFVRIMAEAGLIQNGFRVETVADGAAAVDAFRAAKQPFAAVVLDLTMPVMTGREAFEAIRTIDSNVPVLFASGYSTTEQRPDLPPGTAFLAKPYTPSQLATALLRILRARDDSDGGGI